MRKGRHTARNQVFIARIGYFLCGFAVACWAPLIPLLKDNLELSNFQISQMVLSFGIGSVSGMLISGLILPHLGMKLTYAISSTTTALAICAIAWMPSFEICFAAVILFGVSVGCLEVSINVFAAYIEKKYRLLIMSILFAYYSMGEVLGALMMMLLLTLTLPPSWSIICLMTAIYLISFYYVPQIISIKSADHKENRSFAMPRQPVVSLAIIVAFTYVVGGAILDWSGLFVTQEASVPLHLASYGYCIVSACMLTCRLAARPIIRILGPAVCCISGAGLMIAGLVGMVIFPNVYVTTLCFVMIGIGMSNISPLATSAAGQQKAMPLVSAISFVSICGYTGLLLGPALLGIFFTFIGIKAVFLFLGVLTICSLLLMLLNRQSLNITAAKRLTKNA